jgi:hypothetical protein
VLKQAELGMAVVDIIRLVDISEQDVAAKNWRSPR